MSTTPETLTKYQREVIAQRASCDRRTVDTYLLGDEVRKLARERIEAALVALGLPEHVRADGKAAG
jgi:hypothetical protein